MNDVSALLKRLCPEGVEYKQIKNIARDIFRGAGIKREQLCDKGIPCVRYGEIYTTYGLWFEKCVSYTTLDAVPSPKWIDHGDILFAVTGESVDEISKATAYVGEEKCLAGGDIVVLKHTQNAKYLSYVLDSEMLKKQKRSGKVKSKVVHASISSIEQLVVPIPPLEIQEAIVNVLDRYSEAKGKLIRELALELDARKKQYEYYRDQLLYFDTKVEWKEIEELFPNIRNGFVGTVTPFFTDAENGIRYLEGTNIHNGVISDNEVLYVTRDFHKKHSGSELKADDILMVQSGHIGECAVVGDKYKGANCHALIIMSNGGLCNSKYVCHYFYSEQGKKCLKQAITGGTIKHVLATKIKKVRIPVPPLDVQNRIAEVLDNFERICNDLNIGLPAEIDARQKQYEYYRDLLLTFKIKKG